MIDCKKTENFLSEWYRLCKSKEVAAEACATCKMWFLNNEQMGCKASVMKDPQRAIDIVQKWSDEHPQKTYLTDFLDKHPNAPFDNGIPSGLCPYYLGYMTEKEFNECSTNCQDCWNTPIESEEK
jgi:hypothetical protein